MRAVELSLAEWLELYKELGSAERQLAQAAAEAEHGSEPQLRAEVARLRVEVERALQHVQDELASRRRRAG